MSLSITQKACNRVNYKKTGRNDTEIRYLVVHYTGNRGDTAAANARYFAENDTGTSAHYFVDETAIYQSVPDADVAWHCGTRSTYYHPYCRNGNSIGVEICMLDKNGAVRQGSIDHALQLVRQLMARYDIDVTRVVRHYDVTHKSCPAPFVENPARWTAFQQTLTTQEEEPMTQAQFNTMMDTYLKTLAAAAPSAWSADARAWAEQSGLIAGDDKGNRQYESFCTREALVQMLYRLQKQQ